jgi:hypothetical protein
MHFFIFCTLMMVVSTSYVGYAQGQQPPVTEIYKNHDGNKDGLLEASEVTGSRYARQFARWDVNGDNKVPPKRSLIFASALELQLMGLCYALKNKKWGHQNL